LEYSQQAHQSTDETAGDHYVRNLALSCMAGQKVPKSVEPGSESLKEGRPIRSVIGFHLLVTWLQSESCSHLDRVDIADTLAAVYLHVEAGSAAVADVYSLLGVLENSLGRYGNAYFYTEKFLDLAPNNTRGLLMQLHFTTALGKVAEAAALKHQLQALQAAGKLSVADQQTLALYLE
jgi:tetratricopeptide (TPR) repeat protein